MGSCCYRRLSPSAGASVRPLARFQYPLIKPDRRIDRIRLSDKASCVRPRTVAELRLEMDKPERLVEVRVGEACGASTPSHLVFVTQPLTEPFHDVMIGLDHGVGHPSRLFARPQHPSLR